MCGRYTLSCEKIKEIEEFLSINEIDLVRLNSDDPYSHYNIAPTHEMPVSYETEDSKRFLETMHWGYMGWKPKPGKKPFLPINTRDDSITKNRCGEKHLRREGVLFPPVVFMNGLAKKEIKHHTISIQKMVHLWVLRGSTLI